mmetsp:Transcript_19652/g.34893  ORF Transcript_19652/g.34893 Transcript_19652/m.34893 type:complete len:273 (-) Transcript_19652:1321-2139(-)
MALRWAHGLCHGGLARLPEKLRRNVANESRLCCSYHWSALSSFARIRVITSDSTCFSLCSRMQPASPSHSCEQSCHTLIRAVRSSSAIWARRPSTSFWRRSTRALAWSALCPGGSGVVVLPSSRRGHVRNCTLDTRCFTVDADAAFSSSSSFTCCSSWALAASPSTDCPSNAPSRDCSSSSCRWSLPIWCWDSRSRAARQSVAYTNCCWRSSMSRCSCSLWASSHFTCVSSWVFSASTIGSRSSEEDSTTLAFQSLTVRSFDAVAMVMPSGE